MKKLQNLEPKNVFAFFEEISAIPRGSRNEQAASDYLVAFAKERHLWVHQDAERNIIIKKSATKGYESAPTIIMQGHLDMVNEKNNDVEHDFEQEGLDLLIDGDYIKANGTTLGADNGIAIAYALAILDSNTLKHPALEIVMTTGEEIGMFGAAALDASLLEGKILLNVDSEEESVLWVSCAGGLTAHTHLQKETTTIDADYESFQIGIKGLKGGHSGVDIDKERGNSIKLMGRILNEVSSLDMYVGEINGGSKENAIPRECFASVFIHKDHVEAYKAKMEMFRQDFANEFRVSEPNLTLLFNENNPSSQVVLSKDMTKKVIMAILLTPNGIENMSLDIEGLVETSNNLGVIQTTNEEIITICATRSSVVSRKKALTAELKFVADLIGAEFSITGDYPSWEYNPNSVIRTVFADVHKALYGKDVSFKAIHAGLECGYFAEKIPNIDMVSFGPNMHDIHTPDERLSISSTQRTWEYIVKVLESVTA